MKNFSLYFKVTILWTLVACFSASTSKAPDKGTSPINMGSLSSDRYRRSLEDINLRELRNIQEDVTQVAVIPQTNLPTGTFDKDDGSDERRALFIRRIDDMRDRTKNRRRLNKLRQQPTANLMHLRPNLRNRIRKSSATPQVLLGNSGILPNELNTQGQNINVERHKVNRTPLNGGSSISLKNLFSLEDDDILVTDGQEKFIITSSENISDEEVFGRRIPKADISVRNPIRITGRGASKFSVSNILSGSQVFELESREERDFDDTFENDFSLEDFVIRGEIPQSNPKITDVTGTTFIKHPIISSVTRDNIKLISNPVDGEIFTPLRKLHSNVHVEQLQNPAVIERPALNSAFDVSAISQPVFPEHRSKAHVATRIPAHRNDNTIFHVLNGNGPTQNLKGNFRSSFNKFHPPTSTTLVKSNVHRTPNEHKLDEYSGNLHNVMRHPTIQNSPEALKMNLNPPSSLYETPRTDRQLPTNYEFAFEISEDDIQLGHSESRKANRVEGEYFVMLPSGYRQVVTYYADETGYHPTIRYDPPLMLSPRKVIRKPVQPSILAESRHPPSYARYTASPSTTIQVTENPSDRGTAGYSYTDPTSITNQNVEQRVTDGSKFDAIVFPEETNETKKDDVEQDPELTIAKVYDSNLSVAPHSLSEGSDFKSILIPDDIRTSNEQLSPQTDVFPKNKRAGKSLSDANEVHKLPSLTDTVFGIGPQNHITPVVQVSSVSNARNYPQHRESVDTFGNIPNFNILPLQLLQLPLKSSNLKRNANSKSTTIDINGSPITIKIPKTKWDYLNHSRKNSNIKHDSSHTHADNKRSQLSLSPTFQKYDNFPLKFENNPEFGLLEMRGFSGKRDDPSLRSKMISTQRSSQDSVITEKYKNPTRYPLLLHRIFPRPSCSNDVLFPPSRKSYRSVPIYQQYSFGP